MAEILLEMRNITKTFPGVKALDNVNLKVEKGEIHALVGENGAGKSTLMNVLSGIYPYGTYEGDIIYDGQVCKFDKISDSEEKGIVIIHQELALIPYMSIGENMYLGNEKGKKMAINWDQTYDEADRYLKTVGLNESSHTLIKDIGVGKQQLVEIAKALAVDCKVLIMDEPTTSLTHEESEQLFEIIGTLKARGITTIYISHRLDEIFRICDRAIVMRDGKLVGSSDVRTSTPDDVIMMMSGKVLSQPMGGGRTRRDKAKSIPLLELEHITDGGFIQDLNLTVYQGEVLGIVGESGCGKSGDW